MRYILYLRIHAIHFSTMTCMGQNMHDKRHKRYYATLSCLSRFLPRSRYDTCISLFIYCKLLITIRGNTSVSGCAAPSDLIYRCCCKARQCRWYCGYCFGHCFSLLICFILSLIAARRSSVQLSLMAWLCFSRRSAVHFLPRRLS